jgi:hypothetical protein
MLPVASVAAWPVQKDLDRDDAIVHKSRPANGYRLCSPRPGLLHFRRLAGNRSRNSSSRFASAQALFHCMTGKRLFRRRTGRPLALYVHGLHKCGTMFLYQLFQRLCRDRGMPFYSANHIQPNDHLAGPHLDGDYCAGPVRTFDTRDFVASPRHRVRRIFQVRDPRDILVSQFHSLGWRHSEDRFDEWARACRSAIRGMTVDEYVLEERLALRPLLGRFRFLQTRTWDSDHVLVRYEEMVTDFGRWLERVVPMFEFRWPQLVCWKYAMKYRGEFRPDPNPAGHKRRVMPGDFRTSLQPSTIAALNQALAPVLQSLGYPVEPALAPGEPAARRA